VKSEDKHKKWHLGFSVKAPVPGIELGPEAENESESSFTMDHRMWLLGWSTTEDDDYFSDNIAKWRMREHAAEKRGMLHRF
jgi:hypothetical protein